jgi:hypothetical protein
MLFIDESGTHRGAQKRVQAVQLTLCFSGALEISPKRCTAQRRKRRFRVAHAAKRLTLRKLRSTMQVGRLDVMSNVVSASSLLVHRNEDAENSFSVEPNDVDILRAAALREALPDDQRCIADKCVSVRPLLTALSERNSEHSMTRRRFDLWRNKRLHKQCHC